jgi:anti-sigma factor RsiW
MRTECVSEFVLDAAYGDALNQAQRLALEEHLLECPACSSRRQLLARQRNQFLRRAPEPRLPAPRGSNMRRSRRNANTPRRRRLLNIALLLAMLGLGFALWTRHQHDSASRSQLDASR